MVCGLPFGQVFNLGAWRVGLDRLNALLDARLRPVRLADGDDLPIGHPEVRWNRYLPALSLLISNFPAIASSPLLWNSDIDASTRLAHDGVIERHPENRWLRADSVPDSSAFVYWWRSVLAGNHC